MSPEKRSHSSDNDIMGPSTPKRHFTQGNSPETSYPSWYSEAFTTLRQELKYEARFFQNVYQNLPDSDDKAVTWFAGTYLAPTISDIITACAKRDTSVKIVASNDYITRLKGNSPEQNHQLATKVAEVLDNKATEEQWRENLRSLLEDSFFESNTNAFDSLGELADVTGMKATRLSWLEEFKGETDQKLWSHLMHYYSNEPNRYSNICAVVQSSGMGKSRLADQLGTKHFVIPICLRKGTSGFPPPDEELREFILNTERTEVRVRGRCVALLTSIFEGITRELEGESHKFGRSCNPAKWFYAVMSPEQGQTEVPSIRKKLYESAVNHAKTLSLEIKKQEMTPPKRNKVGGLKSPRMEAGASDLHQAAKKLINLVAFASSVRDSTNTKTLQIVVVFDEAHILNYIHGTTVEGTDTKEWSCFTAFRDIFRSLLYLPIWGLFLSTTGKLSQFNPTSSSDPLDRVVDHRLYSVAPFTDLRFDIFAPQLKFKFDGGLKELSTDTSPGTDTLTVSDITHNSFMVKFGRPLFALRYLKGDAEVRNNIILFAMQKLLCGGDGKLPPVTEDLHRNFACLSQRLALEFNTTSYNFDEERQVEAHMRVCLEIGRDSQYIYSISGSEPILAEAAATLMMSEDFRPANALKHVISGFAVHKGDRGEVVAMLAVTVARDQAILHRLNDDETFKRQMLSGSFDPHTDRAMNFRVLPVVDFLNKLFDLKGVDCTALFEDFKDSYLHFNHFSKVYEHGMCSPNRLLFFMTRGAAMLCANNMPGIDFVLPILMGRTLHERNQTAVLTQEKNLIGLTEEHAEEIFEKMDQNALSLSIGDDTPRPVIRIIFSFGSLPSFSYKRRTISNSKGQTCIVHDIWCGGNQRLLPNSKEPKADWDALAATVSKWRSLFIVKETGMKSDDRMTLWAGSGKDDNHWTWVKGRVDRVSDSH